MRALSVIALLALAALASAKWTNICQESSNCPTIMMGISCQDATLCAVVGGYSDTPFGVYYSNDGFSTMPPQLAKMDDDSLMLLDIAIDQNGAGATAGIGAANISGILITNDVTEWKDSTELNFVEGQDINAFGNGEFGFVGQITLADQGVLISENQKKWVPHAWPFALSNLTQARYGAFPSDQVLYISGGSWPSSRLHGETCYPLSGKTCIELGEAGRDRVAAWDANRAKRAAPGNGYIAVLTKSSDGGKTWETQFQDTNNFYFNDISCIDTTHCFAVGEGFTDGNAPGARIYSTTDGKTWTRVLFNQNQGASLMRVHTLSRTEAWAAGGEVDNGVAYGTFWHTTDAGKTWTKESTVEYVGDVTGFHFANSKLGFAVGVTEFQTSTIMKYTA